MELKPDHFGHDLKVGGLNILLSERNKIRCFKSIKQYRRFSFDYAGGRKGYS